MNDSFVSNYNELPQKERFYAKSISSTLISPFQISMNARQTTETASKVVITVWVATAVCAQKDTLLRRMAEHAQVIAN